MRGKGINYDTGGPGRCGFSHGKRVAVTEFGCCPYAGAAAKDGLGWTKRRVFDALAQASAR